MSFFWSDKTVIVGYLHQSSPFSMKLSPFVIILHIESKTKNELSKKSQSKKIALPDRANFSIGVFRV